MKNLRISASRIDGRCDRGAWTIRAEWEDGNEKCTTRHQREVVIDASAVEFLRAALAPILRVG